ncbi:MAG: hypothetical protein AB8G23_15520 [Myxococcota bacterium]
MKRIFESVSPDKGWLLGVVSAVLAIFAMAGSAWAEVQRVEAVGRYGIKESSRSRVIPRDEAIGRALWEGVSRVAFEVIGEGNQGMGGGEDANRALRAALGSDIVPYTRSFRILEDKGEKPALFKDEPGVRVEYIVVVEVIVDVDRVTSALEAQGLVAASNSINEGPRSAVAIEIEGLSKYAAFNSVLEALRQDLGATRVRVLEFAPNRQLVEVEGTLGTSALSRRLEGLARDQLVLDPVDVDVAGQRIRVVGRWLGASPAAEGL